MTTTNYYDILGVSKESSENEIKKAYRALSLKYHPDRNSSEEAKTKIIEINDAYEVLRDPNSRKEYDTKLGFGNDPFMNMQNEMPDINNLFSMMFGGGGGINMMGGGGGINMMGGGPNIRIFHRGPGNMHAQFQAHSLEPITKNIEISLAQSYNGEPIFFQYDYYIVENNTKTFQKEELQVQIPRGIDHNEIIIIPQKGNIVNSQRSELRLHFSVINNTNLIRRGMDLIYNKKISLKESLCGISFTIDHINGQKLSLNTLNSPNVIKPHFSKEIPGYGMVKDNHTGKLIIMFEIDFPNEISDEQLSKLRQIL
jgi:DnaJ-class molecular chaperone